MPFTGLMLEHLTERPASRVLRIEIAFNRVRLERSKRECVLDGEQ